jgi:hypothetical protein
MKTPREILFQRHRAAESKLDNVRQTGVAVVHDRRAPRNQSATVTDHGYNFGELLLSLRWHFTAMSALWLLAVLLNYEPASPTPFNVAAVNPPSPQTILASLKENRRLLLQLIGTAANEPAALPPRRSEIQFPTMTA